MRLRDIGSYDELNVLVGYEHSEPYEDYFDIDLTEEEKNARITLARMLEEGFTMSLMYAFYLLKSGGQMDWESFQSQLRIDFQDSIEEVGYEVDDEMMDHIFMFAALVSDTTAEHMADVDDLSLEDLYFLSEDRSIFMAEDESHGVSEYEEFLQAMLSGKRTKTWKSMKDSRVRKTHVIADEQTVPINQMFMVGGYEAMYPKDDRLPGKEKIGCRCHALYR